MDIYYRKKIMTSINSVLEMEEFIITSNFYKYFKKFPDDLSEIIQDKITNTESLSFKKIKPWVKDILGYPKSIYIPKFLLCMGWEMPEITEFIRISQTKKSKILLDNKAKSPERYVNSTTSRIEYWLSKGFNEEDAKIKLSERQTTFSRKICIEKYGNKKGNEVFNARQLKWVKTLKNNPNYGEEQIKKNSYKYLDDNHVELINRSSFLENTKSIILECLDVDTIDLFVDRVLEKIDVKRYSDIQSYICSSIIQNKFNKTSNEIRNEFYSKTFHTLKHQTYGIPIYHNGNRYKSVKEYEISIFLEKNNIKFIYEKKYPNSQSKYDFYLPEKDIYIEYYGMLDGKDFNKLNDIQTKYLEKMLSKNLYCEENNLTLLRDTNYNELIKQLNKII